MAILCKTITVITSIFIALSIPSLTFAYLLSQVLSLCHLFSHFTLYFPATLLHSPLISSHLLSSHLISAGFILLYQMSDWSGTLCWKWKINSLSVGNICLYKEIRNSPSVV